MAIGVPKPVMVPLTNLRYSLEGIISENKRRWNAYRAGISGAGTSYTASRANQALREKYMSEYQTAYNKAKAANEARYQEILAGYKTRYSTAMEGLASSRKEIMSGFEGLGEAQLAGIGRRYTKERASVSQGLISSGLYSTTVAPAVLGGVTRREGYATAEAQEQLRRERLGYLRSLSDRELLMQTGLTKEELDFMERREDEYPSESLYVQLMQGLGSS